MPKIVTKEEMEFYCNFFKLRYWYDTSILNKAQYTRGLTMSEWYYDANCDADFMVLTGKRNYIQNGFDAGPEAIYYKIDNA